MSKKNYFKFKKIKIIKTQIQTIKTNFFLKKKKRKEIIIKYINFFILIEIFMKIELSYEFKTSLFGDSKNKL